MHGAAGYTARSRERARRRGFVLVLFWENNERGLAIILRTGLLTPAPGDLPPALPPLLTAESRPAFGGVILVLFVLLFTPLFLLLPPPPLPLLPLLLLLPGTFGLLPILAAAAACGECTMVVRQIACSYAISMSANRK